MRPKNLNVNISHDDQHLGNLFVKAVQHLYVRIKPDFTLEQRIEAIAVAFKEGLDILKDMGPVAIKQLRENNPEFNLALTAIVKFVAQQMEIGQRLPPAKKASIEPPHIEQLKQEFMRAAHNLRIKIKPEFTFEQRMRAMEIGFKNCDAALSAMGTSSVERLRKNDPEFNSVLSEIERFIDRVHSNNQQMQNNSSSSVSAPAIVEDREPVVMSHYRSPSPRAAG